MAEKKKIRLKRKRKSKTLLTENLEIKGLPWKVSVQSDDEYHKEHGTDSDGITYSETGHIYIKHKALNVETILHELGHAYFHSCLLYTTTNLDNEDIEEIFCEIVAVHGIQIVKQARSIYKYLKDTLED